MTDTEIWILGWRMIVNEIEENFEQANVQFDTLQNHSEKIDPRFLLTGIGVKQQLGRMDEIVEILEAQDEDVLREICTHRTIAQMHPCDGITFKEVMNKALQKEIVEMYVADQVARGNRLEGIISKFEIDTATISEDAAEVVDERNRNRLKQIIRKYGFPSRKLIGRDAMQGVFLLIQHSDQDKEWQKAQLNNIENAVKNGDLDSQSYACLYDRIKVNSGEKQLYGTQFARVDPPNKVVELAETEDVENLDNRRMTMGLMPIEMYKAFMLQNAE